jgi:hypothetical protein
MPDSGERFMSLIAINEDQYAVAVASSAGDYVFTREQVGTRYVLLGVRIFVDPSDPSDLDEAHALQAAIKTHQADAGRFEVPKWDQASRDRVRDALLALAATVPDLRGMFGVKGEVDPVRHLIGTASGWGGNPEHDAMYVTVTPKQNDGQAIHRLSVRDVPVDAFWSITVYNADGYLEPNEYESYSINNITAKKDADGSVTVEFGGCDGELPNCIPITPGWNYWVRLYRPRDDVLNGSWTFPAAQPAP